MQFKQINWLIFLTSLMIFGFYFSINQKEYYPIKLSVTNGFIDLSNLKSENSPPIALDGDWEFYWNEFLDLKEIENKKEKQYLKVPGNWTGHNSGGLIDTYSGYATYRIKIKLPDKDRIYSLKLPTIHTAYSLFINDKKVFTSGKVSKQKEDSLPSSLTKIVNFIPDKEEIDIVLHVSNFNFNIAGIWTSIYFGNIDPISNLKNQNAYLDLVLFGSLCIMAIYHIFLYSMRTENKSTLYFGLLCFLFSLRTLLGGEILFFSFFPDANWFIALKMLYLLFPLISIIFSFFIYSLYRSDYPKKNLNYTVYPSLVYIIIIIVTDTPIFSYLLLNLFIFFSFVPILFNIYALLKASYHKRDGALVFLFGFFILFLSLVNDILFDAGVIKSRYLLSIGFFVLILCQATVLAIKFTLAFFKEENLALELSQTNIAYKRFLPEEFLNELNVENVISIKLGDQIQKEMTVMFSDIRSFTTLSETMSPQENFNFLNSYLKKVSPIIRNNNGFIDKYVGDAIMALFAKDPEDGLKSAIGIQEEIRAYNKYRMKRGYDPIAIGSGLHYGSLILGTIGYEDRLEGTVISDTVNLASRVEGLTKIYNASILITDNLFAKIRDADRYYYRVLDRVIVKGKNQSIQVIEILNGQPDYKIELFIKTKRDFEFAVCAYQLKNFIEAKSLFERVLELNPLDVATKLYTKRINYYLEYGVPVDWDGVEIMESK